MKSKIPTKSAGNMPMLRSWLAGQRKEISGRSEFPVAKPRMWKREEEPSLCYG